MPKKTDTDEEKTIADALELLEEDGPKTAQTSGEPVEEDFPSPTIELIGADRRPSAPTVCERCSHAMWHATATDLKCYCRVMHVMSWVSTDPMPLTHCDGEYSEM